MKPFKRAWTWTGCLALLIATALCFSSPVHASTLWGGIAYDSQGNTYPLWDGGSEVAVRKTAIKKYGEKINVVVFHSGECGAVVKVDDGTGNATIAAGVGETEDRAFTNAVNMVVILPFGQAHKIPLRTYCQG